MDSDDNDNDNDHDDDDWKTCYDWDGKHLTTYGGGPEGGYAWRHGHWCVWRRNWGNPPVV